MIRRRPLLPAATAMVRARQASTASSQRMSEVVYSYWKSPRKAPPVMIRRRPLLPAATAMVHARQASTASSQQMLEVVYSCVRGRRATGRAAGDGQVEKEEAFVL
jgi:hypothetical protein